MQSYVEISNSTTLTASLSQILGNDKSIMTDFSGTAFPTTNLFVGMKCFRTDQNKTYRLVSIGPSVWTLHVNHNETVAYLTDISASTTALIDAAPNTLNTLAKLADAIANDPNFATTLATLIGTKASLDSPSLTGTPRAPTAASTTNTTQIATTAFANAAAVAAVSAKANTNSAALTGTPTAPTPAAGDNSTRIATTEFVSALLPIGTIIDYAGSSPPANFLACPTSPVTASRITYAALFAVAGIAWGATDGFSNFTIPWFPADYAAIQSNGNVGTQWVGQLLAHTHNYLSSTATAPQSGSSTQCMINPTITATSSVGGGANYAAGSRVLKCIKYQ